MRTKMMPQAKTKPTNHQPNSSFWDGAKFPIAIAHRGGVITAGKDKHRLENTIDAFYGAAELGYKYIELDVIKTADNKVIVIHVAKNWFESIFGKKDAPSYPSLQKMTYQQIRHRLGRKVPTLDEVLQKFPKNKIFVEVKSAEVLEQTVAIINQNQAMNRTCIVSFYPDRLERLRRLAPDAWLGLNMSKSPVHYLQSWRKLRNKSWREKVKISYVGWPNYTLNRNVVRSIHGWGIKVLVYAPNDEKSINKSLAAGADGIISDNIALLKEVISQTK